MDHHFHCWALAAAEGAAASEGKSDVCFPQISSHPAQCASVTNKTSHISATAALACRNVCRDSVKMIAAHQPTRFPSIRQPHAKIANAARAAAIADGKRAEKSLSPKIL